MTPDSSFEAWKQARVGSLGINPRTVFTAGIEAAADIQGFFEFTHRGERYRLQPEQHFPHVLKWQMLRDEGGYWSDWCSVKSVRQAFEAIDDAHEYGERLVEACS